jgi:hypothetical protein
MTPTVIFSFLGPKGEPTPVNLGGNDYAPREAETRDQFRQRVLAAEKNALKPLTPTVWLNVLPEGFRFPDKKND